ncbi:hypothetical protein WKI40_18175 [Kosakonia sacchari]|uniref:hypothetical protein n=1 Tax=Kosakonia sacchari TaxID=1158459 RepID=UPI0030C13DCA
MAIDIQDRITKIFETGIYYHAALQKYKSQVEGIDYLEKMVVQSSIPAKTDLWNAINLYLTEHHPYKAQQIYFVLAGKAAHTDIPRYVRMMKQDRSLILSLDILSEAFRNKLSAELLLENYFSVHHLTKGFTVFDEQALADILQKLRPLELIRKDNLLFCNRISCQIEKQSGYISVYYDDKKTSFRQALKWAVAVVGKQDGLATLSEAKTALSLKSFAGILATFAFESQRKTPGIGKQQFFKHLCDKYPYETEVGFADTRFITRAQEKIDEIKNVISQFYEINKEDKAREAFSTAEQPKIESLDNVDPHTRVKSALSVYVNYYAYLLANHEFFRALYTVRTAIDTELQRCKISEAQRKSDLLSILNGAHIIDDPKVKAIEQKYAAVLERINEVSPDFKSWGYFFCEDFVPSLQGIIALFSQLKKSCGDDFSQLTHADISPEKIHIDLKKAIVINMLLPQQNMFTAAGYGAGNPAKILPHNNKEDVVGNIQAALDLFDGHLLRHYLSHVTLDNKLKKLEELLWGMHYHYEKAWGAVKITDDKCLQQIDAWYDEPVSANRFQQGKKAARKLINSFMSPMENAGGH